MLGSAKDLPQRTTLPSLDWEPERAAESLERLREFVIERANAAIGYYQYAKRPKKQWATWLRMAALLFAGAAGILPILSQIILDDQGRILLAPAWASVFLALAAGAVAIDRFFGYSSAWMRFMASELRVRRVVDAFELEWEEARAGWGAAAPDASGIRESIARAKAFSEHVADIVRDETDEWIAEFRETIRQLDEAARGRRRAREPGPQAGPEPAETPVPGAGRG